MVIIMKRLFLISLFAVGLAYANPTISSFTATPQTTTSGGSVTLAWTTAGTTSNWGSWSGTLAGTSVIVNPTAMTNYCLQAIDTATGVRQQCVPVWVGAG